MKVKEKSQKVVLKLRVQKTKIMASSPITSKQIDGKTVADFIFGGSQITADGDCSHESKRHLLLGRKVMTKLDSILKSRDITLPTKVQLIKAIFFSAVMYGCECWTIKKAECRRIDAFELWYWRRLLEVPRTARRSIHPKGDQSWVFIGSWNFKSLATWCEELTHWKDPDAGKDWGQEAKGTAEDEMVGWHHWLNGHEFG